jgi:F0F1-type ATP synthase membrane subunit c/vacuolar-type H+-ATPase subunit K
VLVLSGDPLNWFGLLSSALARALLAGGIVWLCYAAIEPYVRRLWPDTLIAWTRAIAGQWRDPLVGRHVLLGALAGLAFSALFYLDVLVAPRFGIASNEPSGNLDALTGVAGRVAAFFGSLQDALMIPVAALVVILLLRVLLRRPWLAYLAAGGITVLVQAGGQPTVVSLITSLSVAALALLVLTRLGLLAFTAGIAFSSWSTTLLTTDPSSWFFTSSLLTMALYAAVAIYAFVISLGGQAILKDPLIGQ